MTPLTLFELNNLVRSTLELGLPEEYWVIAELSEVNRRSNGHCYIELVQKDKHNDALIAKARGCIWRDAYMLLAPYFEETTGRPLTAGMTVLLEVNIRFHELYGYSLIVTDIDPSYTMGDMARRRKEIVDKLTAEGVADLNKELLLPRPLLRIAVISSPSAAGYGDFCKQLEQSEGPFVTQLFPAVMQGQQVEQSVITALNAIAEECDKWDVVVIIRGGGAVSDLSGFDTELLAANVAQFPLPIFSGIGHERDDTVIDAVAHTRFKTPTAVAAFLVAQYRTETETLAETARRLVQAVRTIPTTETERLGRLSQRMQMGTVRVLSHERSIVGNAILHLNRLADKYTQDCRAQLDSLLQSIRHAAARRVTDEAHCLALAENKIELASPDRLLRMGFSITLCDGRIVRHATDVTAGQHLVTRLADGTVSSDVTHTEKKP